MLQSIFADCGIVPEKFEPVHGGDINSCYCLYKGNDRYFLKVNDASAFPGMFEKEARGLAALQQQDGLSMPSVIRCGQTGMRQYLLLEWMQKGVISNGFWERFGKSLAGMHKKQQEHFGWEEDNYIGSLEQSNTPMDTWPQFYANARILPLVKKLFDSGSYTSKDTLIAESLCKKLPALFPEEAPSLLHGDLWAGNFMILPNGNAGLYDPAVYCGHREMDLGMTLLFGGFDSRFYLSYDQHFPLENGWKSRLPLTQLYPLLVHALLFGGHYIGSTREILKGFY